MTGDVFDRIRGACARVAAQAEHVRSDDAALERLAGRLVAGEIESGADPVHAPLSDPGHTLAFVVTLDAINFGSGWFPELRKRDGRSGYFTVALALRERFEAEGPWSAEQLCSLTTDACAGVFGQPDAGARELMEHFARALRELGDWLATRHGGSFEKAVASADGSAARLVEALAELPSYRDEAHYCGFAVPFYKRAQITASDLALAFDGAGPGRFDDLDRLTLFADNLVPHVLRCADVLVYAPELAARIDGGELLRIGEPAEVEIRAVAVDGVERLSAACARRGAALPPRRLDALLWQHGQRPEIKARPRHRARSTYY